MMAEPEKKPTIDERIEALVHTAELFQADLRLANKRARRSERAARTLRDTVLAHEREHERYRRVLRAALNEWLREDVNGGNPGRDTKSEG